MTGTNVEDVYGLSPLQEGILFHCLYGADDTLYVTTFACTLRGLAPAAFQRAWERAVERHPTLRTAFAWEGLRQPVQVVGRRAAVAWRSEDWRGLEPGHLEELWQEVLRDEPRRLQKLTRAPLLRLSLFQMGDDEHRFVFSHHHLILDGWSLPVLLGEVFALYGGERNGGAVALPPARPFRDFVAWLRQRDMAAAEAYWRRTLDGVSETTTLGVDRGSVGAPVGEVGTRSLRLPPAEVDLLRASCRAAGHTLNTLVQGAWALALARWCGRDDVVFGVSVAGRPAELAGVEGMLGVFTNTLPLRVRIDMGATAEAWLQRLQESQVEMRRHEHSPLSLVQRWSGAPAGRPLFEIILVFESYPALGAAAGDRNGLAPLDVSSALKTSSPLLASANPGDGLALVLAYDRVRFDGAAMARLLAHWRALLGELAREPRRTLDTVPAWSAAERHQILAEWNDTLEPPGGFVPVHELIAARAAAAPGRTAIVHGEAALTYGELAARAEAGARRLAALGVGPESVVAVLAERSPEAVAALLGVLAAGGAYLPLDSDHPREHLARVLAEVPVAAVLASRTLVDRLPPLAVPSLVLDARDELPVGAEAPVPAASPGRLAYVISTSGSTGRPKAVMVDHGALANHTLAAVGGYGLTADDRVLQFASLAFDASAEEIFPCLAAGATLVLRDDAMLESADRFLAVCGRQRITVLDLPTAFWSELASQARKLPPDLRLTIVGGERALAESVLRWGALLAPGSRLVNTYGPTECTVVATRSDLSTAARAGERLRDVPIGRPIGNLRAAVLGRDLSPVPAGASGELCLAGAGLARGYLGRPDLTAERFVPDPVSPLPGGRLYRTGDLARHRPDGELEFLGRVDRQVKVRGFRIEPAEIEAALLEHPKVAAAAVVPAAGPDGRTRLLAYLASPAGPDTGELRRFLAERLPEHMLPAGFTILATLPLTASGKVDRRALTAFDDARPEPERAPLRTPVEETLAAVWAGVLGVSRVGAHDSFFDLGGDSILSLQVVARARDAGLRITPQQIFERRTLAEVAAVAELARTAAPRREVTAGPVPLTPIQRRFLEARPSDPHWFNQAVLLAAAEPLAAVRLARAVERVAACHGAFRLRFREQQGRWCQESVGPRGGAAISVVDLSTLPAATVPAALADAAAGAQASLALDRGPLLRAVLLPLPAGGADRLLLVAHHLVIDGVSWRILVEDLIAAYRRPERKLPASSPFQGWAARLDAHARSGELDGELEIWRAAVPDRLSPLPLDLAGGEDTVGAARTIVAELETEATAALLREMPRAALARVDEALLAALACALRRWTGEEETWIEVEGHGREEVFADLDLSRTVGWLTVIHPLRLRAPRGAAPGAVLRGVKEELRRVPRRGLGYGLLRALETGGLPPHPRPQILFNYLGRLDRGLPEDALFRFAAEPSGPPASPRQARGHAVEINAGVRDGRLRLALTYPGRQLLPGTAQALADGCLDALREILRSAGPACWAASDLPLLRLGPGELDELLRELPGDVEDVYPLSPLQQGMHFHALLEPRSGVYFTQMCCELEGALEPAALRRAWERVVERHPALRTSFVWQGRDEPLQVVHRGVDLPWDERDWRPLDQQAAGEGLERLLAEDRERGFDLSRPPLLRCALVRLAEERWFFAWSIHHLLVDGWCQSLLFGEVFAHYAAAARGEALDLLPAPRYRDHIAWLRRQDLAAAEAHWRRELAGFTAPSPLGIDRAAPLRDRLGSAYEEREIWLGPEETGALAAAGRRHELTLGTVLAGLWGLLLGRYSGEADVVFGMAVSGRSVDLPGADATVGLFLNTLPVRVAVREQEPLLSWLAALQARLVEARRYEHAPLVEVQGWSAVPRGLPLFESLLVVENYPVDPAFAAALARHGDGLRVHGIRSFDRVSYPLTLQALPGERLRLRLKFEASRFEAPWIEAALHQLAGLCRQWLDEPATPLAGLSLVTPGTSLPDPANVLAQPFFTPVPERVHELARHLPELVAVRRGGREWSYAELGERSAAIARSLLGRGLAPGEVVAVQGEAGFGRIAALLAVMSAGGVLLALDRHLPLERRRLMVAEAGARRALAVGGAAAADLPAALEVTEVDPESGRLAGDGAGARDEALPLLSPDAPAYVFFTSGTTAVPRAVLGCHKGLSHFVAWQREAFRVGPGDRVAHMTGVSFDVVLRELFLPLTSGAALSVPPVEGPADPAAVLPWIEEEGVTLLHAVPALAQSWLEARPAGGAAGALRCVFFAGEALTDALVRRWRAAYPGAEVVNLYGPTETTLAKCWHQVAAEPQPGVQPVGRPLPQTQALVLAGERQCGVAEPGEIVLRTPFRTLGYLNAPEENRRRFAPNPRGADDQDLLYRTGDRGRHRPDGSLEILGRLDDQVKVRGVRIDPHEVAAVLARHPGVAAAAVTAGPDGRGETRLVAYVVPAQQELPPDLRAWAALHLPPAAVPAATVALERLPLTANGKLDRRALPEPAWTQERAEDAAGRARTPVEEVVAAVWSEVLRRERIGVEESLFDLGGHSLMAIAILSRLRRALDVEIPLHRLFAEPTVAGLAREAERLLRAGCRAATPTLQRMPAGVELPLSFAQERLWFLDQIDPDNPVYNVDAGARLAGPLYPALLARSLREVVRRHDTLRACFAAVDGHARLVLQESSAIDLPLADLGGLPSALADAERRRLARAQVNQPFDLRRPPLLRAALVRLDADDHALLLTFHHAVADAWSIGVLLREIAALYAAFRRGRPLPLAAPPLRYVDFAWWQREWLRGAALDAELAFWRELLDGAPEAIDLPTDRPRPALQSFRGGRVTRHWPPAFAELVRRLAQSAAATPFMALLAALGALLHRWSGQTDLVVGSPVAGRGRVELESLVGLFVNSLAIRCRPAPHRGFGELLGAVRRTVLDAWAHQDTPFEKVVEALQPERNLAHNPLFQVMLVVQNAPVPERIDTGLSLSPLEQEVGTARLDLTLSASEGAAGLFLLVDYATDLFDGTTARRLAEQLGALLAAAAADPGRRLDDLPVLPAAERHQLVVEWNDTEEAFPTGLCLHQLFEAQARARPEATAVVAAEGTWTYGELDRHADRLARHLRSLGVGPDVRVGLAVHRSFDMLAALLGILKAGGAYVPLDPEYPAERLTRMLEDAAPAVLVTEEPLLATLPLPAAVPVVLLDAHREAIAGHTAQPLPSGAAAHDLAYVIYTSGSTGRPLGVMLDHAGVVNTLFWRRRQFDLRPDDRVLQNISLSFDPSVWQIFGALTNGARLVLPAAEEHKDVDALVELMARHEVTIADFPPSLLRALLEHPGLRACRLRQVFAGGEALPPAVRDACVATLAAELHNVYGPTEASIDATSWGCRGAWRPGPVPIGRPMANKQVLLLDARLAPVPLGVTGELAIAGSGLARGYHGRPDLTADRFRPHPASARPGARLYRTGDLARFLPDGALQFLGRADHQVKVRGVRIELAEVESALAGHPSVREAVVLARRAGVADDRLEAWVVPATDPPPSARQLGDHLRRLLPQAMVPAEVFVVDAIPRTPTGKVDRRALAARRTAATERHGRPEAPPRTSAEAALVEIWQEVLGRDRLGVEDNFFEVGGDSILSIQIVARAARCGLRLSPRQVFLHQTIAELAVVAEPIAGDAGGAAAQGPVAGAVPLTPIQRWFFDQAPAEPWHFNQAVRLEPARPIPPGILAGAVACLVRHHDALRLRFAPVADGVEQEHASPDEPAPFAVVDLSALPAAARDGAVEAAEGAIQRSLDLARGPLLRATLLVAGGETPPRLLLVAHHLVVDGVSWRILVEDLETACSRLLAGLAPDLPAKTTSFRGWAERLAELAGSPAVEGELERWVALLDGPAARLPVDVPGEARETLDVTAGTVAVALETETTAGLLAETPVVYNARLDEVLLAALAITVARWTGQRSLLVALEGHGRESERFEGVDLSRTVGWFTSVYPVRLDLGHDGGVVGGLRAVKEQVRAVPGHGLGYGLLRYLRGGAAEARLRALPRPEISFNYLGQFDRPRSQAALLRPAGEAAGRARSPLWRRRHLLEVNSLLAGGRLHCHWRYSEALHRRATVELLAEGFLGALRDILDACRQPGVDGRTVSDFPLIAGTQAQLDRLMRKFGRVGERKGAS